MIGQTLGHYQLLASLGKGGTGEVYRARDLHLEREVAIKVLDDEEGVPRALLRREARALAAVLHRNVAALHGFEEEGDQAFLVMELVEGESLDRRLARGRLSLEQAVTWAAQIASALEAAHQRGVVHRDLKPANVQVHPAGDLKVLDFGLARQRLPFVEDRSGTTSDSSTQTDDATFTGRIAGTLPYMSPEQLRAEEACEQTDVWALGCVLFECLTGKRAFAAETPSDTVARVLRGAPDWSLLPTATPPQLERLLRRCLQRHREARQRDVGDVLLELEEIRSTLRRPQPAVESGTPEPQRRLRAALPWVVVLLLAALLAWAWSARRATEDRPAMQPTPAEIDDAFLTIRVPREEVESLLRTDPDIVEPAEPTVVGESPDR